MRMTVCTGSKRPIRQVIMNRDDDLLFAASVDGIITLWNPENGERMGTYVGHRGTVNSIAVDYMSKYLVSGSDDGTIRIWNVMDGKEVHNFIPNTNGLTSVDFATGDKLLLGSTRELLGKKASIHIYRNPMIDNNDSDSKEEDDKISEIIIKNDSKTKQFKVAKAMWSPVNDKIYAGCNDGTIRIIDVKKEKETHKILFDPTFSQKRKIDSHLSPDITDMQFCNDLTCLIVSSRNHEARMFDLTSRNFDCIKTYSSDRGLNTVTVHPTVSGVVIGGGKKATDAATDGSCGKYEILFEHMLFEEKMASIDVECFSPLNTMTFNSDGSLLVLGDEAGTVRMLKMDANFEKMWKRQEDKMTRIHLDGDDIAIEDDDNE